MQLLNTACGIRYNGSATAKSSPNQKPTSNHKPQVVVETRGATATTTIEKSAAKNQKTKATPKNIDKAFLKSYIYVSIRYLDL